MGDNKPEKLLENLFESFDSRKTGYLGKSELRRLCKGISLTDDEFETIFRELDSDGDEKISKDDFVRGFADSHELFLDGCLGPEESQQQQVGYRNSNHSNNTHSSPNTPSVTSQSTDSHWSREFSLNSQGSIDDFRPPRGPLNRQASWKKFTEEIGLDYYLMSPEGQEEICDLYLQLSDPTTMHLLENFEGVVQNLVKELKKQECENERLEKSFKREKESHSQHLKHLEEETEIQTKAAETRVRKEEQERYEVEKQELKGEFESEILQLQENLKKLQKLEIPVKGDDSDEIRKQLEDLCHENRYLKRNLTDAQTNLALQRSELVTMKQTLDDKTRELEMDRNTLLDYIKEQESLNRQVHLLQDANKKLHDTNDDLRAALESATPGTPLSLSEPRHPMSLNLQDSLNRQDSEQKSAYVREYLSSNTAEVLQHDSKGNPMTPCCLAAEISTSSRAKKILPAQDSVEVEDLPEDFDSGHSTLQGIQEMDMDVDRHSDFSKHSDHTGNTPGRPSTCHHSPRKKTRVLRSPTSGTTTTYEDSMSEQEDLLYLENNPPQIELTSEMEEELERSRPSFSRANSTCSQCSEHSRNSGGKKSGSSVHFRKKYLLPELPSPVAAPERMYKVVLCGDAAVGKSSFIMRLCKNKFVNNLNSTLGVDFQTKTLEVDGRCVALQLWDTAGQERFRSIAKSYFRRADGVLLLYDCTYERSFMSVREWVDAVEDGAEKKIPLMLVANKTDLRDSKEETEVTRCVKTEDGKRLAREFDAVFIETSAKSGSNIAEAALEFARLLKANEDLEVKTVGMQLHDLNSSKSKSCATC